MRLFTLFKMNGEYLPYDRAGGVTHHIATMLIQNAQLKALKESNDSLQELAHAEAERFHLEIMKSIDDEFNKEEI